MIRGRKVILRKSRLPITSENEGVYTLLEFFNSINMRRYKEDFMVRESINNFIKEKKINCQEIYSLASYFPARAIKNLAISGVLYEITQQ